MVFISFLIDKMRIVEVQCNSNKNLFRFRSDFTTPRWLHHLFFLLISFVISEKMRSPAILTGGKSQ